MKQSTVSRGFSCRICNRKFDAKNQRSLHYKIDHEGESPFHCAKCGKGFASKSGFYGHNQNHRDKSQLRVGSGIHKCQHCGKEFIRRDSYKEHLLIHNGPKHKCPHCPKEFVQRSNLVRHIRIHTGEKPYKCLYCEKLFSDKGACNSHISVHTREESCSCPYCGQTFSKKQKLKYHIRKHTGEGLVKCDICNKSFTNTGTLKEHRVLHNRETEYPCEQCGKSFSSGKYLQRHVMGVHHPSTNTYTCSLCPKKLSHKSGLKAHLMTHSGVKPIKCLLCNKAYSLRKSLRHHLRVVHDISPEHPQYKHCFHAMSLAETGLSIPEDVPKSMHSFEVSDEDSISQSSPEEKYEVKEEGRLQPIMKNSPKKVDTVRRKTPSSIDPNYSAASEDYSSSSSSTTERRRLRRPRKTRKSGRVRQRKSPIKKTNDKITASPSTSGEGHQWTSTVGTRLQVILETLQKSSNSPTSGRNSPQDLEMEVVEEEEEEDEDDDDDDDDDDTVVEVKKEQDEEKILGLHEEVEEAEDASDNPSMNNLIPLIIFKSPASSDEEESNAYS